ncbi:hypothetical protein [Pararhodobacter oceanensis]|uniref:Uncharacterized protein n=1 Tax=Pararhodobacter oceanensis TaxID=2172121 RepID=A0A2T8HWA8_9RHOB|nr:hypothetical protein [Pararhodobacter oceanensis]PVH29709.1 hypothetical protein DDE20_06240 [Pararhodobacter oceanensis]
MGLISKTVFYAAIAGAGAAFATKPSIDEVRLLFQQRLATQIEDGSIVNADDSATQALLAACQISPANCARLLEGAVSMEYSDYLLAAVVDARTPGFEPRQCLAAFDRLFCR